MRPLLKTLCLAGLIGGHQALADEVCEQGRIEISEALAHARLDDYTRRQVNEEIAKLEQARRQNGDAGCRESVDKLKAILHLDH